MFDVAPTELLLVAVVALVVIGPKDLPKAMRFVGYWVGRARGVARQFRSGFDAMVREAEVQEMEKKWAEENERIMREHPAAPSASIAHHPGAGDTVDGDTPPVMVEQPMVAPAPEPEPEPEPQSAPPKPRKPRAPRVRKTAPKAES